MTGKLDMRNPLDVADDYWISVDNPKASLDDHLSPYTGKWMLFIAPEYIHDVWITIQRETIADNLGISAKCGTSKENLNKTGRGILICVYTPDYRDLDNVKRVLSKLRSLGHQTRLNYKEDAATMAGLYQGKKIPASLYTSAQGTEFKQLREPFAA